MIDCPCRSGRTSSCHSGLHCCHFFLVAACEERSSFRDGVQYIRFHWNPSGYHHCVTTPSYATHRLFISIDHSVSCYLCDPSYGRLSLYFIPIQSTGHPCSSEQTCRHLASNHGSESWCLMSTLGVISWGRSCCNLVASALQFFLLIFCLTPVEKAILPGWVSVSLTTFSTDLASMHLISVSMPGRPHSCQSASTGVAIC